MSKYIKPLNYADFIFNLTMLLPLLLWLWFGSQLLKYIVPTTSKVGIRISKTIAFPLFYLHILVFFLWLIPVYISLRGLYYAAFVDNKGNATFDPSTPSLPPGFGYCMTTKIKKEDAEKGIVAYFDYKCEDQNEKLIISESTALLNRFYYVNYGIFHIILLVYNSMNKFNIFNNKFILLNIDFALFLGVIGCMISAFDQFYYRSLWFTSTWAHLLSMNCVCLMLIGLAIMSYSRRYHLQKWAMNLSK